MVAICVGVPIVEMLVRLHTSLAVGLENGVIQILDAGAVARARAQAPR